MKRRYLIVIAVLVLLLCGFWPRISKTATGIAQKTIQIVSSANVVLGTGGATAGPAPAEVVNVVDSTNHIIDSFGANLASPGPIGGTTSSTGQFTTLCTGTSPCTLPGTTGDESVGNSLGVGVAADGTVGHISLPNLGAIFGKDSGGTLRRVFLVNSDNNIYLGSSGGVGTVQIANGNLQVTGNVTISAGGTVQSAGGAVPTCSGGSGTCVTVTGSTNNRGQIHLTGGTAVTSITLTFSTAGTWGQAPFCTVGSGTAVVAGLAAPTGACASTASCAFAVSSTTAADINYTCL